MPCSQGVIEPYFEWLEHQPMTASQKHQREGAAARRLMRLAKACPDFAPLVEGICVAPDPLERALAEELRALTHPKQWLMALHLTCTYLAAKNVDKVPARSPASRPRLPVLGAHLARLPNLCAWALCTAVHARVNLPGRWRRSEPQTVDCLRNFEMTFQ